MDNIETLQVYSLMVLVIWGLIGATTIPFLVIAANGHRRSTLMTVAILAVLGFLMSATLYDAAEHSAEAVRSTRLWINLYAARSGSLLMALTLGWRIWRVMLGTSIEDS